MVNRENRLLIRALKILSNVSIKLYVRSTQTYFILLVFFVWLFSMIGINGTHSLLLWCFCMSMIISLFENALDMAKAGY